MPPLSDLQGLVDQGLIKIKKIQEKHKNPKVGNEVAEIAKQLSDTMIGEYYSFTKEQMQVFNSKVEAATVVLDGIEKNVKEKVDKATININASIEKIENIHAELEEKVNHSLEDVHVSIHAEKDRLLAEANIVRQIIETKSSDVKETVQKFAIQIKDEQQDILRFVDKVKDTADKLRDEIRAELNQTKKDVVNEVIEEIGSNFLKIVWIWVKSFFRKK